MRVTCNLICTITIVWNGNAHIPVERVSLAKTFLFSQKIAKKLIISLTAVATSKSQTNRRLSRSTLSIVLVRLHTYLRYKATLRQPVQPTTFMLWFQLAQTQTTRTS